MFWKCKKGDLQKFMYLMYLTYEKLRKTKQKEKHSIV